MPLLGKLSRRSVARSSSSSSCDVLTISYDCPCSYREKDNEYEPSSPSMRFVRCSTSAFQVILNQRGRIAKTKTTNKIFSNGSVRDLYRVKSIKVFFLWSKIPSSDSHQPNWKDKLLILFSLVLSFSPTRLTAVVSRSNSDVSITVRMRNVKRKIRRVYLIIAGFAKPFVKRCRPMHLHILLWILRFFTYNLQCNVQKMCE